VHICLRILKIKQPFFFAQITVGPPSESEMPPKSKKTQNDADDAITTSHANNKRKAANSTDELSKKVKTASHNGRTLEEMNKAFGFSHPAAVIELWEWAKQLNAQKPKDAFTEMSGLQLVGLFDFLNGELDNLAVDRLLVHCRYSSDLPEMQTFMIYNEGRFCYWRDEPTAETPYIVHVSHKDENFPKIDCVGQTDPFHALLYLTKQLKKDFSSCYPSGFDFSATEKAMTAAKQARSKEKLGKPLHGFGIKVPFENDIGYRPVCDNKNSLKKDLIDVATTNSEDLKKMKRDSILQLHFAVQFANDEKDFGMGLEFGHDLFYSNFETFHKLAHNTLKTAYEQLGRLRFVEILEALERHGRFRKDVSLIS
jgi:hypothetical protein